MLQHAVLIPHAFPSYTFTKENQLPIFMCFGKQQPKFSFGIKRSVSKWLNASIINIINEKLWLKGLKISPAWQTAIILCIITTVKNTHRNMLLKVNLFRYHFTITACSNLTFLINNDQLVTGHLINYYNHKLNTITRLSTHTENFINVIESQLLCVSRCPVWYKWNLQ